MLELREVEAPDYAGSRRAAQIGRPASGGIIRAPAPNGGRDGASRRLPIPARAPDFPLLNVLFEDDGQLKAGAVLADNDATLQVEAVSGKRLKVKAGHVLLRFASPGPGEALAEGQRLAAELDPPFLWEVAATTSSASPNLAREYYGGAPTPAQAGWPWC